MIADGVDAELDEVRSLARDSEAAHPRARGARARAHRDLVAQDPLQPRLRLLDRGLARQRREGAGRLRAPADAGQRRALRDAGAPGARGAASSAPRSASSQLERELFEQLRRAVAAAAPGLARAARAVAEVDLLAGWAELAARRGYVRPEVLPAGSGLRIRDGRHPVVEATLGEAFVPNDAELDPETAQIVLLTGPNMGGKSTYLRQVALIVADGAGRLLRPGGVGRDRRGRPDLHARRRQRRPGARRVDLHGRDDRDRQHPPLRDARAAWSSSTRSAAAPRPSTASRSPGRSSSTCTSTSAPADPFRDPLPRAHRARRAAAAGRRTGRWRSRSGRTRSSSCAG